MAWTLTTDDGVDLRVHGVSLPTRRPVAVVLHGAGSTASFALRCLRGPLRVAGYDVVAPDLRGHGGSTPLADPDGHSLDRHLADVLALADTVDVRLLAGISLGGEVALRCLAAGLQPVDGAVVCLPGIVGPQSLPAAATRAAAEAIDAIGLDAVLDRMAETPGALPWVVAEVQSSWRQHDPRSLSAALRAAADAEPLEVDVLAGISLPVGLVGARDDPAHPLVTAERLASSLARAGLEVVSLAELHDDPARLGRAAVRALDQAVSGSR